MGDMQNLVETFRETVRDIHAANPSWETNLVMCKMEEILSHLMSGKEQSEQYLKNIKSGLYE